ncbi:AraC family transcriptional regulator [Peteryoungia desertarenae]|uniref:AraC family transcriptional regulator n=1 Tax=Peteryoungia desertarenae TaxID=1813451 RepID=A0ABX6QS30_9HYPH|nr:AraC family transcriptional regulator [Peteryoungia desertarenae]QLF70975.1 AraC family transcriptional regulator [Peteryoungia desertarenae]
MDGFIPHGTPIKGLEAVSATSAHVFPRHTHESFGIGFIAAGGQVSASGRGQVEASTGQVITVNPGEVHDGAPIGRHPRTWHMLHLSQDLVRHLATDLVSRPENFEFEAPVLTDCALRERLAALYQLVLASANEHDRQRRLEEELFLLIAAVIRPTGERSPGRSSTTLQRVREMIDEDPTQPADLEGLSQIAGMSRFQLIRAFASLTGLTPHAYLMQQRANLSRRLMAGKASLADIAAICGYVDQSHMHREFKRRYGMTPGAYRATFHARNSIQDEIQAGHA